MQSTERVDDHRTWQRCCLCSWQSTIDPYGLSLWPGTIEVILHHEIKKPLDGTVTLLTSISLASASTVCLGNCCCVVAYAEWAVAWTLRQRATALFVHQVHVRAYRSLLPIAQSSIRLIVVRSSNPSLTRHLSCCAWAPAKSGGDCWHNPHILLGDVRARYFCCCFCNQQRWLSHGTTRCCFPQWQHKGLWLMHLLQWQSQRDQFHRRRYGTSLQWWGAAIGRIDFIRSALAPSRLSKVVAQTPIVARGLLLPCTAYTALRPFMVRGSLLSCMTYAANLPLWQGAHCRTQPSCHPWQQFVIAFFGKGLIVTLLDKCGLLGALAVLTLGGIHAFSNILVILDLGVFVLLVIALCDVVVAASCKWQHIIFDCCMGVILFFPRLHLFLLSLLAIRHKEMILCHWRLHCDVAINLIAGALQLCDRQCGWSTLMKSWLSLAQSCALVTINHCCQHHSLLQHGIGRDHCVKDVVVLRSMLAPMMQHKGLVCCCLAQSWFLHLNQPSFVVIPCDTTKKTNTHCRHPCNQQCLLLSSLQPTACIIFDCCILVSCNGVITLLAPLQPLQYDRFLQHQNVIVVASLVIQH